MFGQEGGKTMDFLKLAREAMEWAKDDTSDTVTLAIAQAAATVAQAESLQRIEVLLERLVSQKE